MTTDYDNTDPQARLWPALLRVQEKLGNLARSAENPFFKSSYVPLDKLLDAVRPVLTSEGIVLAQAVQAGASDYPCLVTVLHHAESGEQFEDAYPIRCTDARNPQQFGAAVSYARRYGLKALLGIAEEDDDGNAAAAKAANPAAAPRSAPPPTPRPSQAPNVSQGKGGSQGGKEWKPVKPVECPACGMKAVFPSQKIPGGYYCSGGKYGGCGSEWTARDWVAASTETAPASDDDFKF